MRWWIGAMLLLLSVACTTTPRDEGRALRLAEQLHTYWQQQQWDALLALYEPSFLASQGRDAWLRSLQQKREKLGELRSYELQSKQVDARFSGDFYIYVYRLRFQHGALRETLTIYKKLNQDALRVVGHVLRDAGHG